MTPFLTRPICLGLIAAATLAQPYQLRAQTAFTPTKISSEPAFGFASTRGWTIAPGPNTNEQIFITHVGIFDSGSDGLVSSHEVGVWGGVQGADGDVQQELLASATVPAGTAAPLINGYRYVSLTPIVPVVRAPEAMRIGALYSANDPDDQERPTDGIFAPNLRGGPWGQLGSGSVLSPPNATITIKPENPLQYRFFPVNFMFTAVPEPSSYALFSVGAGILFLARKRLRGR